MEKINESLCQDCGIIIDSNYERCYNCNLQHKIDNDTSFKESEGEEYISEYLIDRGISFKKQKVITGLKGDDKSYRRADFYLEDYGVYIEYDGYWHIDKERYTEKKKIYEKNKVPCIYLYPENLAVLDFFLDKRLQNVLEKHDLQKELKLYHRYKFWKSESRRFWLIGAVLLIIIALLTLNDDKEGAGIYILLSSIIGFQLWRLWVVYQDIFYHRKYPLYYIDY